MLSSEVIIVCISLLVHTSIDNLCAGSMDNLDTLAFCLFLVCINHVYYVDVPDARLFCPDLVYYSSEL